MKNLFLSLGLAVLSCGVGQNMSAQVVKNERLYSFEGQVPQEITGRGCTFGINDEHYKDGKNSLSWKFEPNAVLSLKKDIKFEPVDKTGKDQYLSAFVVWVYNEKAIDKKIRFQFLKDGKVCTSFPFGINFTGWRAAWICFERDMEGKPEVGMNEMQVLAPDVKGELFIDHLITAVKLDGRQQASDFQVPFVQKETTNHWLVIYPHSKLTTDLPLQPITEKEKKQMNLIEKRYKSLIYTPSKVTEKTLEKIREHYNRYAITYKNGKVSGLPIFLCRHAEAYERMLPNWNKDMFQHLGMEMREYFDLMKQISFEQK